MERTNSSSLYINTDHYTQTSRSQHRTGNMSSTDRDFHLRVESINNILKVRRDIKGLNRCILYMIVAYIAIIIGVTIITGLILSGTYSKLREKIDHENEEVYLMLQTLYKKCKENPMDFDWTTQIFRRIEEAEYTIMDKTAQKIMMSFDKRFKDMLNAGKISDDSLFKIKIKLDKAEGFEIDAKAAGPEEYGSDDLARPRPTRKRSPRLNPRTNPNPKPTTKWKGPTGIPGVWLSSEEGN
ncbi:small hydrophobic protein [Shaan virus]|uniref:Small hydrophobic protein n=1 Tax=Shaan virus TaxID=2848072 RepID=A0A346NTM4_9MONO|nr:small hydrophobic protein [Bat paramyxovirus]AXR70617.1 small hydrophobic protein [Shaan virus]